MTQKITQTLCLMSLFCLAIGYNASSQNAFQKTFGGALDDYSASVQQTADDGFIIAGYTSSYGAGLEDVYLIKTNIDGDTVWTKTYGGASGDFCNSVQQTTDGGYILAGYTASFGAGSSDVYLIKTNAVGDTVWTKTYGGAGEDSAYFVSQTYDGGYIITGNTNSYGAGALDVYLVKTDSLGSVLWTSTFGGTLDDYGWTVKQTSDTGYVIAGHTVSFGAGNEDVYLIKTDAAGTLVWTQTYGGSALDYGLSVQQTTDGGYIVAGYSAIPWPSDAWAEVYLIKTDPLGNTLWAKTYGQDFSSEWGNAVQQTADGGYIITGGDWPGEDALLIKTDSIGDTLWTKIFSGLNLDAIEFVQQTNDAGFILSGRTASFGAVGMDVYLVKTDANGNSGCNESPANYNVNNATPSVSSGGTQASGIITGNTATLTGNTTTVDSVLCFNSCNLLLTTVISNVDCFGDSTGSVDLTVSNGVSPFTYSWSNGATTEDVSGLPAGSYSVTVTDSLNCMASDSVIITQSPEMTSSTTSNNVSCNGGNDGDATVLAGGGTPGYTYLWSSGSTDSTATGLSANTYTVTVTDSLGCTIFDTVSIIEPVALTINNLSSTQDSTGNCIGEATVIATGGTPPYTYLWDDPNSQTDLVATGLCPGTYCVTVTDLNGCTKDTCAIVAVGIEEMAAISGITIFPNPNNGEFILEIKVISKQDMSIEICNTIGQKIFAEDLNQFAGIYRKEFNLKEYVAGVYYLKIEADGVQLTRKVLISR